MNRIDLHVELLTDVSVSASNRSLGDSGALDYLPGRLFWGVAATAAYAEAGEAGRAEIDGIFQAGRLRFLDAVPSVDGQRSFPTPLAWQRPKYGGQPDLAHNFAHDATRQDQTEQFRPWGAGWRLPDGGALQPATRYSLRTAMTAAGRPEQGLLFGIESLAAGTVLHGALVAADEALLERALPWILGERRVGRSRGSEYGLVRISRAAQPAAALPGPAGDVTRVSFLVLSRLGLRDAQTGQPRLIPDGADFHVPPDWELIPEASFVRTSRFSPFHGLRRRPENERQVLDPGCVLTFAGPTPVSLDALRRDLAGGVGLWRAEGHGEVAVLPDWLAEPEIHLAEAPVPAAPQPVPAPTDELFAWAAARSAARSVDGQQAALAVADFAQLEPYGLPASQWGVIHRLAREAARTKLDLPALTAKLKTMTTEGVPGLPRLWGKRLHGQTASEVLLMLCAERQGDPRWLEHLANRGLRRAPADDEGKR